MGLFGNKKPEQLKIIWHAPEGRDDLIPRRATKGAMAYDLVSPIDIILPRCNVALGVGSALVDTLVAVTLPKEYGLVLRSRSGLANKAGITVEAGEIDSDYRGLLKVLLYNHGGVDYEVKAGDRIAQARVVRIYDLEEKISYEYPDLDETARGDKGFGSTGD